VNPVLATIPLWQAYPGDSLNGDFTNCFAPNSRALATALEECQFRVERSTTVSMGGYVGATAISDDHAARYQSLDSRLELSPFDPDVPYFLDEEGSVHSVTGKGRAVAEPGVAPAAGRRRARWRFPPARRRSRRP
jgi:hypothetical protein